MTRIADAFAVRTLRTQHVSYLLSSHGWHSAAHATAIAGIATVSTNRRARFNSRVRECAPLSVSRSTDAAASSAEYQAQFSVDCIKDKIATLSCDPFLSAADPASRASPSRDAVRRIRSTPPHLCCASLFLAALERSLLRRCVVAVLSRRMMQENVELGSLKRHQKRPRPRAAWQ